MFRKSTVRVVSSLSKQIFSRRFNSTIAPVPADEPYKYHELPNKLKVVTNPLRAHFLAIGVYVNAGLRFETPKFQGVSHLIDKLAYNSTKNILGIEIHRNLESLGGNYMCSSSRELMMYQALVFNKDVGEMTRLISETVVSPLMTVEEIEDQKNFAGYEINEIWKKADLILPELFHVIAYGGSNLGSPLLCAAEQLPNITKEIIDEYRQKFYNPENTTLAFIGVPEDEALLIAEKNFGHWKSSSNGVPSTFAPAKYTGGEFTLDNNNSAVESTQESFNPGDNLAYIHLGFEGLAVSDPDIYTLALLQTLLGGGGSFLAGGPGKGMFAKLYTEVLNKYGFIENCTAFNHLYLDLGLFGISAACDPLAAAYLVEILCQQFAMIMYEDKGISGGLSNRRSTAKSPRGISASDLARAKNQLVLSLLMNLESKMVELEDVGRQIQVHGYKVALSEMISKVESVRLHDIRRVAERIVTGKASDNGTGKATVVIQGERDTFGDINGVLKSYGLGNITSVETMSGNNNTKSKKRGWW